MSIVRKQKSELSNTVIELEVSLAEVKGQLDERTRDMRALHASYDNAVSEIETERDQYKEFINDLQHKKGNDSSMYHGETD